MISMLKQYALLALKGAAIGVVVVGVNRQFLIFGQDNATRHVY